VEPRTRQDGSIVELIGSKTVSGTPTAAGDAAGCQPFEMTFDVEMNRGG
jgi:hypothetical protein